MTLAEQLVDHCSAENRSEGFGALMSFSVTLSALLAKHRGRSLRVAPSVSLLIPGECQWKTYDQADGSVQFAFNGMLPRIGAEHGVIRVMPDVTALTARLGAAALEMQASLRLGMVPLPPFTLTIPLV